MSDESTQTRYEFRRKTLEKSVATRRKIQAREANKKRRKPDSPSTKKAKARKRALQPHDTNTSKAKRRKRNKRVDPPWRPRKYYARKGKFGGSMAELNGVLKKSPIRPKPQKPAPEPVTGDSTTMAVTSTPPRKPSSQTLPSSPGRIMMTTQGGLIVDGATSVDAMPADASFTSPGMSRIQRRSQSGTETILVRTRETHTIDGVFSVYVPEHKHDNGDVFIPELTDELKAKIEAKNYPTDNELEVSISLRDLNGVQKRSKLRRQLSMQARHPSNQRVTGVGTNAYMEALGFDGKDWHAWHLVGHSLWHKPLQRVDKDSDLPDPEKANRLHDPSQFIENFVFGKKNGNAIMSDIAESLIRKILKDERCDDDQSLYLHVKAEWLEGFEKARIAQKVIWTLKDGPKDEHNRMVRFEFHPLKTPTITQAEIDAFKQVLCDLFWNESVELQTSPAQGQSTVVTKMRSPIRNEPSNRNRSNVVRNPNARARRPLSMKPPTSATEPALDRASRAYPSSPTAGAIQAPNPGEDSNVHEPLQSLHARFVEGMAKIDEAEPLAPNNSVAGNRDENAGFFSQFPTLPMFDYFSSRLQRTRLPRLSESPPSSPTSSPSPQSPSKPR